MAFDYDTDGVGVSFQTVAGGVSAVGTVPNERGVLVAMECYAGLVTSRGDGGELYVSDRDRHTILKITLSGLFPVARVTAEVESPECAEGEAEPQLASPVGLVWADKAETIILTAMRSCNRLATINPATGQVVHVVGTGSTGRVAADSGILAELDHPESLARWRDRVYVTTDGNSGIFAIYPLQNWRTVVIVNGDVDGTTANNIPFDAATFGLKNDLNSIHLWSNCWLAISQSDSVTHIVDPAVEDYISDNGDPSPVVYLLDRGVNGSPWKWTSLDPLGRVWAAASYETQDALLLLEPHYPNCSTPVTTCHTGWETGTQSTTQSLGPSSASATATASFHASSTQMISVTREISPRATDSDPIDQIAAMSTQTHTRTAAPSLPPTPMSSAISTTTVAQVFTTAPPSCSVTQLDAPVNPFGSVSPTRLSTQGWNQSAVTYSFGYYYSASSTFPVIVATDRTSPEYTLTAPLPEANALSVWFVVSTFDGKDAMVGSVKCELTVSSPSNLTAVREAHYEQLAAAAGNRTKTLAAAQILASLTDSSTTAVEKDTLKTNVVAALAASFTGGDEVGTFLTKGHRMILIQALARVCKGTQNTYSSAKEKQEIADLVAVILNTTASRDILTANQGADLLAVINHIDDKAAIRSSTQLLAKACAANVEVGGKQSWVGSKYTVTGAKMTAADAKDTTLSSNRTEVVIPTALVEAIPDTPLGTAVVSISIVDYLHNPTESGTVLESQATEICLQVDGSGVSVHGLTDPVKITMLLRDDLPLKPRYACRYYNTTADAWTSEGLTLASTNATHVQCLSTHLSTFAVEETTGTNDKFGQALMIGLSVGLSLLVLLILVAVCLMCRRRKPAPTNLKPVGAKGRRAVEVQSALCARRTVGRFSDAASATTASSAFGQGSGPSSPRFSTSCSTVSSGGDVHADTDDASLPCPNPLEIDDLSLN